MTSVNPCYAGNDPVFSKKALEYLPNVELVSSLKMNDYDYERSAPWYPYKKWISRVEIEDGVTSIGSMAFCGSYELRRKIRSQTGASILRIPSPRRKRIALAAKGRQLYFCNIKPTPMLRSVVDFQAFGKFSGVLGWKCCVQRCNAVRIEVFHYKNNPFGHRILLG